MPNSINSNSLNYRPLVDDMSKELLYSISMKASKEAPHEFGVTHVSGAENLVQENKIYKVINSMIVRAMTHENGIPDFININIEKISNNINQIKTISSLPLITVGSNSHEESKVFCFKLLEYTGIKPDIAEKGLSLLTSGASPERKNMHGAIIMNASTGERYEPDNYKGVRVSKVDMTEEAKNELMFNLRMQNLGQYSRRIGESLVSASKVVSITGTIADLCLPDEPNYSLGYIASEKLGYIRIPHMKTNGLGRGGRVIFVKNININEYINELKEQPVLINRIIKMNFIINQEEYFKILK